MDKARDVDEFAERNIRGARALVVAMEGESEKVRVKT